MEQPVSIEWSWSKYRYDIVLRSNGIVIPDALQKRVIGQAHEGHQGLFKARSFFISKVWFSEVDAAVDQVS